MNRRQLMFFVLVNALVSLVIALGVVLTFEMRRPDPEELAAINSPRVEPVLAAAGDPQITSVSSPATGSSAPAADDNDDNAAPNSEASAGEDVGAQDVNEDAAAPEDEEYVVQAGDSLSLIANRYNITIDDIVRTNNLANPDSIFSGQRLVIPLQGRQSAQENLEPSAPLGEGVEISLVENGGDPASESVMIVNESNLAFSLLGWRLEREGGPAYTFGNVPLFPGSSVRVHTGNGEDSSIDLYWDAGGPQWQSGAVGRLVNTQGVEVHQYTVP